VALERGFSANPPGGLFSEPFSRMLMVGDNSACLDFPGGAWGVFFAALCPCCSDMPPHESE